ncbi:protoporphyrinogen/coproporphyrinogen oxidase [Hymenobacter pini]|uniref:protoporphyrinogen/coproporphyrinogen oxidase n=1 Tax=Hymenobacter pini TaxID=2880879 RepID=UPI001CF508DA|nr:NAD(P)/FAD-dependent oxidoreductase [Hymenobacter pini]MCA8832524.1 FAD-dependent oxidoreductase [Hymenobacter pini]
MNTADATQLPVIIIGAGLAGLSCACYLHRAGRPVLLLEAADAVGGRVRTDVTPDGFRLDRGFQVLLTRYPEVERLIDYGALNLQAFRSGAVIRLPDGQETTLVNPLQQPTAAFSALTSRIGTLPDKLRIVSMVQHVRRFTSQQLLSRNSTTALSTLEFLRQYGWSEQMINNFFRPFFGGVFLDRTLSTAANFFEFVFKQFVEAEAALPALGMQQIPEQLAARLPAGSLRLNTRVQSIQGTSVQLENGETLTGAAVVVAVDGETARHLLPAPDQLFTDHPTTRWRHTTCTYFAAPAAKGRPDKLLRLNAASTGLAHNVAFPSDVAPAYAPAGQRLVSVSTHGAHGLSEEELTARLRHELPQWFGAEAAQWRHLRTYHIPHALPEYPAGQPARQSLRLQPGLYRCGDYTAYPSLNAALASGREAADMILAG